MNKRIFIERKLGFENELKALSSDLASTFNFNDLDLSYYLVYDLFNIEDSLYDEVISKVFYESNKDILLDNIDLSKQYLAFEFLPGQFDQRASSSVECIKLTDPSSNIIVRTGTVITFNKEVSQEVFKKISKYLINPVDSRIKDLTTLELPQDSTPSDVEILNNFITLNKDELKNLFKDMSLAMNFEDFLFIQEYFKNEEQRNPYITEIKVLDTYWSDHCRHTTFETVIEDVTFSEDLLTKQIEKSFNDYLAIRKELKRDYKPITLMDLATINAKYEKYRGNLDDIEISDEINAASIYIDVIVNDTKEKWLLMFKNETHNHPTEIEPYGGASTCIGGAIRDPLSGRSYVYSASRVTGAKNINERIEDTIPGKLPQKTISKEAAHGYSTYGNQIGLATSNVKEIYHDGFVAKRMEVGAVVGAVKASYVRRDKPSEGDLILLLGGKTGKDGIGGATGSSKTHTEESVDKASAEVQKGNAIEERKIQRLFRNKDVTKLIKKSNDFGAGGVSVAVGELADGLIIDLDKVPTKYTGLNGTELAISESQERMAVVIEAHTLNEFRDYAEKENIEVSVIATVTKENRLIMKWNNQIICNLSREFIDTSGVKQKIKIKFEEANIKSILNRDIEGSSLRDKMINLITDKNVASQQGMVEMFDSSIGRTTVLAPYGGKYQLTKTQSSIHKIPVLNADTSTVSIMTFGYNPYLTEKSPYLGSMYSVIESVSKIVSSGISHENIRFSFQEYFEKLENNPVKWSKPLGALLGAFEAQLAFKAPAIGGKDSMSGTFNDLKVPPTLISFAVKTGDINTVISPEFKKENSNLYLIKHTQNQFDYPNFEQLNQNYNFIFDLIKDKEIFSAYSLDSGGLLEAIIKPTFGNQIGVKVYTDLNLFNYDYGSILIETDKKLDYPNAIYLGKTTSENIVEINNQVFTIKELVKLNQKLYKDVYPIVHKDEQIMKDFKLNTKTNKITALGKNNVKVLLPVFPGTNCEYDSAAAFTKEGAEVTTFVFTNQTFKDTLSSISQLSKLIDETDIVMFSGGFSSADEPDGSGKFIANVLMNETVKQSIENLLARKGLILGICNGFQALVKSGLLPSGNVSPIKEDDPTLFKNTINRHISKIAKTKVCSVNSPWLYDFKLESTHLIPVSHGEGKFVVNEETFKSLVENNQLAFQYVDEHDNPTYNPLYNPNGSTYAVEGIISKDGLILGKMGHSERYDNKLYQNIPNISSQNIFKNAINYFTKKGELN
ncbi:phosphoribosylformylglycinamidine synthase [Candidatus Izimaplasma bacterium ZiA1]|uniref:phosphoribosylformylglycinamidine synthase n=1 Tax=Candidatus Izimoplasma sp. ZiA1 TaxID=2024899 RepID=UPI000BAA48FF|nr:phosphoribosylformylglycinamidine synthase [Candidatus Izimaplasma bacterium ZiA1]